MNRPIKNILSAGDRAPSCIGISAKGTVYAFEEQAGRAAVLILARRLTSLGFEALLKELSGYADELSSREVDLVALVDEDVEKVFEFNLSHPSRVNLVGALNDFLERNKLNTKLPEVLAGSPGDFMEQIGFDGVAPEILVVDRGLRIEGRIASNNPEQMVAITMATVRGLLTEEARDIYTPAPVIILPHLFDFDFCRELVELHKTSVTAESPAFALGAEGQMLHKLDYNLKKRRDCLLEREHPMHVRITDILMRRCIPEIKRAFQADVSYTDRINIACYPGDGGHFRRHRDNRPDIVSYRKFALSINLTTTADGYEGGHLLLPEYNPHHYRCPPGAGIIFSVALLHEITPVLSGNRYVMVTHFHDEEGEIKWLKMRETLSKMDLTME